MKLNQKPIILFLDFDGVLHPILSSPGKFFSKLKNFENTIRAYNNINIIISSNWRYQYTMDELLAFFSVDIQRRVIDCTRDVEISKAKNRYEEIFDYLEFTNQMHSSWIAIDDSILEFPENLPNVVFCKPNLGFDEGAANCLKERLKKFED